jgi:hypothetical protein
MQNILVTMSVALMLSATSYAFGGNTRDHRGGKTPEGGVTVGHAPGYRGGGGSRSGGPIKTTVKTAPQTPPSQNWGIPGPGDSSSKLPSNVNDHRSRCTSC